VWQSIKLFWNKGQGRDEFIRVKGMGTGVQEWGEVQYKERVFTFMPTFIVKVLCLYVSIKAKRPQGM
jgi:hypothetical protein